MEGLLDNNMYVFGARLTGLFRELNNYQGRQKRQMSRRRIHRIRVCGLSLIIGYIYVHSIGIITRRGRIRLLNAIGQTDFT